MYLVRRHAAAQEHQVLQPALQPVRMAATKGSGMTVITDPKTNILKHVDPCRSCAAPVYWSTTDAGKLCPFNVVDGEPTRVSHFTTCPEARNWTKKK